MAIDIDVVARHLASDDAVAVLLRGHLWIEEALAELIRANLDYPDEWKDLNRLTFPSKVALARAQGGLVCADEALLELNRVRNRLAHNVLFDIDHAAATALRNAFCQIQVGESTEVGLPLPQPPPADAPVVEVVRGVVLSLLTYLSIFTAEVLNLKTILIEDHTKKLKALMISRSPGDDVSNADFVWSMRPAANGLE